jgi:polysaccharide deacetylase 2 family uncharacterized protein YibQ
MRLRRTWRLALLVALGSLAAGAAADNDTHVAQPAAKHSPPILSIIIDDLGDRLDDGVHAINLQGQVTYAVLPQTTYSRRLSELAHAAGKEVMLHQPMQAMNGKAMGPGGMGMHMTRSEMQETLRANLASVPYAVGVNNHMGSLLTRHPGQMAWFMEALKQHGGLYFVDSTTSRYTVAKKVAVEYQLPTTRRNVFLDNVRDDRSIVHQFVRLIQKARTDGHALAIGHPYPETISVLERILPHIEQFGVRLVPVSELIAHKNERREQLWQASLSPLHKGVKSLKQ